MYPLVLQQRLKVPWCSGARAVLACFAQSRQVIDEADGLAIFRCSCTWCMCEHLIAYSPVRGLLLLAALPPSDF